MYADAVRLAPVAVAADELKNVIKGGEVSTSLPSIIDRAKSECLQAGESLAKKYVPGTLPPEPVTSSKIS